MITTSRDEPICCYYPMLSLSEVSLSEEKCDGVAGFAVIKQSLLLSEVSLSELHCSGSMFHIAPTKKKQ